MKLSQIGKSFDVEELPHGMFYEFDWGVRFDLSDVETHTGTQHIERFLSSLQRAKEITHACFEDSEEITVLFSGYGPTNPVPSFNRALSQLIEIGFDNGRLGYLGSIRQGDEDDNDWRYRHWYGCRLKGEPKEIDKLLWNCVAQDMGVQPYAEWAGIYLVDFSKHLIVHVYDDRGMDIVAMDKATIEPFYHKFNNWLLDFDREAMDKKFK